MKNLPVGKMVLVVCAGMMLSSGCVSRRTVTREVVVTPPREVVVAQAPPAVVVEQRTVSPGPGYVYVEGAWVWRNNRWDWERGKWVRPPRSHAVWVPAHYRVQNGRHVYIPGYWR